MRKLVIFGDSAFAERLYEYIRQEAVDEVIAFTQEEKFITRESIQCKKVLPFEHLSDLLIDIEFEIVLGIGYTKMNELREKVYLLCKSHDYMVAKYISRNAHCYSDNIGEGTIILPGSLIGPDCQIGVCNFFESSCSLSHDNIIGDFNFFSTNVVLGGYAKVGNHCFIGLHSTVKNDIVIADYTFVGASANVLKTTMPNQMYIGNPAVIRDGISLYDINI